MCNILVLERFSRDVAGHQQLVGWNMLMRLTGRDRMDHKI